MSTYNTEAIILKQRLFREDDLLVSLYTKKFGLIEVLAQGAKKIQSKLAGSLQPFQENLVMIARGRNIERLAQTVIENSHRQIYSDLDSLLVARQICEISQKIFKSHHPDSKIYSLLQRCLNFLENNKNPQIIFAYYFWQFSSYLGFTPELRKCLKCGQKNSAQLTWFDYHLGGLLCEKCLSHKRLGKSVNQPFIKLLRGLLWLNLPFLVKIKLSDRQQEKVKQLVREYFNYQIN